MKIKKRDRFNDFPREITIDILSRLPVRTIINCKCVCKPWRDLVESSDFASWHYRRAALSSDRLPAIRDLKLSYTHSHIGFIGDNEVIQKASNGLVLSHTWPNLNNPTIHSSANGLLLMIDQHLHFASDQHFVFDLFICNPITREYVRLENRGCRCCSCTCGFGLSKSGHYKLVQIYRSKNTYKCQVYTLGTGQWKSIAIETQFDYYNGYKAACVKGNLHWLVLDLPEAPVRICCLDLETELFTSFSLPPLRLEPHKYYYFISNLGGSLCFSDAAYDNGFEIWCMKEYGNDKSWTKDYVIKMESYMFEFMFYPIMLHPIKVFEDGGILIASQPCQLLYYSNATKAIQQITNGEWSDSRIVIYSTNFVSLKSLVSESTKVESF